MDASSVGCEESDETRSSSPHSDPCAVMARYVCAKAASACLPLIRLQADACSSMACGDRPFGLWLQAEG
jgi:hypothetical protein